MTSSLILSSKSMKQRRDGPIAILWDIENCCVPSGVRPEDVAGNIRTALHAHSSINGAVNTFSAYGDFGKFPLKLREGCQRTGVKLVDVPNGRKDAADKAILVDMFLFALDNPPPSSIMLISGDVDFSQALHVLGQRGYTMILVVPSGPVVSSALSNAGSYVWEWSSLARGQGFVPPSKTHKNLDAKIKEAKVISIKTSVATQLSNSNDVILVQPGDLNRLKGELVKLLKATDGCLSLGRIRPEYEKAFGRTLHVSAYGALKLSDLLRRMSDAISVEVQGPDTVALLKKRSTKAIIKLKTKVVSSQIKIKKEQEKKMKKKDL